MSQSPQRFCTTCGQPLASSTTFCVSCGARIDVSSVTAPGPLASGAAPGSALYSDSDQTPAPEDLLLAGLIVGSGVRRGRSRRERRLLRQSRRSSRTPGARARGCGCILLLLALLVGPFIGAALTTGVPHEIFSYVAGGMILLLVLFLLIGALATRDGREALTEGLVETILESLFGGG